MNLPSNASVPPNGLALASALLRATGTHRFAVAWIPAPTGACLHLLSVTEGEHTVAWKPGSEGEPRVVGLGSALRVQTAGPERFAAARDAIENCFRDIAPPAVALEANRTPPALRFFGGAAFVPGRDGSGCWESFGDATFVLPKWTYVDHGTHAWLGVVVEAAGPFAEVAERADELLTVARRASGPRPGAAPAVPTAQLECRESTSEEEWGEHIASIQSGIRSGAYEKVVAARRSTLRLSPAPEPAVVLERLDELAPACTRFALRIGTRTFVGASPERLVRRAGRIVETEAIAGSIPRSAPDAGATLLASRKDLSEHQYVVRAIRSALEPLAETLEVAPSPEIRELRHVLHLRTPIRATLKDDVHVLELTDRLHPTPAVGGVPTNQALDWIVAQESAERGWYASPVGWVDERGDGEMVVALRSALINGDRVHLYAGAGIVDESDAGAEYAETEIKLAGMRGALGLPV